MMSSLSPTESVLFRACFCSLGSFDGFTSTYTENGHRMLRLVFLDDEVHLLPGNGVCQ